MPAYRAPNADRARRHDRRGVGARRVAAGEVVVAERGGTPVGCVHLEYLWGAVPFVALIHVAAAHRGRGVGRALLAFLEHELRARGHAVLLSSAQAGEPAPQAWHRHVGFAECGILAGINAGGIGEVFFRKSLAPIEAARGGARADAT